MNSTRVWRDSSPKRNEMKQIIKNRCIGELTRLGKCPKRPYEMTIKELEKLVLEYRGN